MLPTSPVSPRRTNLAILLTALGAVALYFLLPQGMNELARRCATIFFVAVVFWAGEIIPLFATALLILGFQILFLATDGGLAGKVLPTFSAWPLHPASQKPLQLSVRDFFAPFSSSVILLFLGSFFLASAVSKHGLDRTLASRFLRPFVRSPLLLLFAVLGGTAFLSMWMSNTAASAVMLSSMAPLLAVVPQQERFRQALILAIPFGANLGGMGTPIGTPPNVIALAALKPLGLSISFLQWTLVLLPLVLLLVGVAGVLLYLLFRPQGAWHPPALPPSDALSGQGRMTGVILLLTIFLWLTQPWHGLDEAAVALLAAAALSAFGLFEKEDLASIPWGLLILMWGGLSLGISLQKTGLLAYLLALIPAQMQGLSLIVLFTGLSLLMATFLSHTATTALLVPLALSFGGSKGPLLALLVALTSSLGMAMPISTAPNAIAFSTGGITSRSFLVAGGILSLLGWLLLLAAHMLLLRFLLPARLP